MSETSYKPFSPARALDRSLEIGLLLRRLVFPLVLLSGTLFLWVISLPQIDPTKMNDLGLVSVLPWTFIASLVLLAISFMITLHQKDSPPLVLFLHILLLIFIIHGTPQIVYGTVRYSWAWKHAGIIDYIQRNGSVDPTITNLNAYHNWPGFFALAAMYNTVAGISSSLAYAGWGPVFFNILDIGALYLLFTSLTTDRRLVWLGLWFYLLFSWVGQDYFSPQAFAYFLFLVCLAIVLRWFRHYAVAVQVNTSAAPRFPRVVGLYNWIANHSISERLPYPSANVRQRLFLAFLLITIFFVIASSHQLTPFMLLSALALLVIFQVTNQRYLPILMATITAVWIIYMAVGFLNGNLYWIVQSIGSLLDNLNSNVNLAVASPGQQFIAQVDRLLSAFVWVLGIAGLYRRYRSGRWDFVAILLSIAPIPMLALNSYGGEMIFRVYMFGLPFIVFLAAALFYPSLKTSPTIKTPLMSALLTFILIPGFLLSYYGKERMYYFSPNEIAAAQYVFTVAPKGALIVDGIWDWPRQYTHYEDYNYLSILLLPPDQRQAILQNPAKVLPGYLDVAAPGSVFTVPLADIAQPGSAAAATAGETNKMDYTAAYIVITRSQIAEAEMTGTLPNDWSGAIIRSLSHSPEFRVVYSNPDAVVIQFIDTLEH